MSEETDMIKLKTGLAVLLAATLFLTLASCAAFEAASTFGKPLVLGAPAAVSPDNTEPGLEIRFIFKKVRRLNSMPTSEGMIRRAQKGAPIPNLDRSFDRGEIFDSGETQGVCCYIKGFLNLEQPGLYYFQAMSNDGFRLSLEGNQVIQDPEVHSDRLSLIGKVQADTGGWYPLDVLYFQRKGTAAIKLYWKKPGDKKFSIVPPEVFRHQP